MKLYKGSRTRKKVCVPKNCNGVYYAFGSSDIQCGTKDEAEAFLARERANAATRKADAGVRKAAEERAKKERAENAAAERRKREEKERQQREQREMQKEEVAVRKAAEELVKKQKAEKLAADREAREAKEAARRAELEGERKALAERRAKEAEEREERQRLASAKRKEKAAKTEKNLLALVLGNTTRNVAAVQQTAEERASYILARMLKIKERVQEFPALDQDSFQDRYDENAQETLLAPLPASVKPPKPCHGIELQKNQESVYAVAAMRAADKIRTPGLLVKHGTGSGKTIIGLLIMLAFWNKTWTDEGGTERVWGIFSVSTTKNQQEDNPIEKLAEYCITYFSFHETRIYNGHTDNAPAFIFSKSFWESDFADKDKYKNQLEWAAAQILSRIQMGINDSLLQDKDVLRSKVRDRSALEAADEDDDGASPPPRAAEDAEELAAQKGDDELAAERAYNAYSKYVNRRLKQSQTVSKKGKKKSKALLDFGGLGRDFTPILFPHDRHHFFRMKVKVQNAEQARKKANEFKKLYKHLVPLVMGHFNALARPALKTMQLPTEEEAAAAAEECAVQGAAECRDKECKVCLKNPDGKACQECIERCMRKNRKRCAEEQQQHSYAVLEPLVQILFGVTVDEFMRDDFNQRCVEAMDAGVKFKDGLQGAFYQVTGRGKDPAIDFVAFGVNDQDAVKGLRTPITVQKYLIEQQVTEIRLDQLREMMTSVKALFIALAAENQIEIDLLEHTVKKVPKQAILDDEDDEEEDQEDNKAQKAADDESDDEPDELDNIFMEEGLFMKMNERRQIQHCVFILDEVQLLFNVPAGERREDYEKLVYAMKYYRDPATTWVACLTATPGSTPAEVAGIMAMITTCPDRYLPRAAVEARSIVQPDYKAQLYRPPDGSPYTVVEVTPGTVVEVVRGTTSKERVTHAFFEPSEDVFRIRTRPVLDAAEGVDIARRRT